MENETPIHCTDADPALQQQIAAEWGEVAARHMHFADGFSVVALAGGNPVGLISVYWRPLPPPLLETCEGYIDIIEVRPGFRRRGIARRLVEIAIERAKAHDAYQLRAWSSDDKMEAIPMWKALGFGLCPATVTSRGQEVKGYFVTKPI